MDTHPDGVMKKRGCENEENEEPSQEARKKMKIEGNDTCLKQQEIKTSSKEKKPRLSALTFGEESQIGYDQLYEFLKYAALGKHHNVPQSSWCRMHHQRSLAGVTVVVLDQVDQLHFYRFYLQFKHLRKTFRHRFSLLPISDDVIEHLCRGTVNSHPQPSREEMDKDPIIQKRRDRSRHLSRYCLSPEEMRLHNYPVEGDRDYDHFVPTGCSGPATDGSPLFGLDCEMCLTDKGSELTRIALVDPGGRCLMNELVKPKLPIRNYLTSYSGITEKLLQPVETTLAEIQSRLRDLLPSDVVLVGHSLNTDLRALEMIHPNIIDTSLLFSRRGGMRFKLKFLAEAVLGKEIQREDQMGHNPVEDARCALELAQYFIDQGSRKVAQLNLEAKWSEQKKLGETQSLVRAKRENGVQEGLQKPPQSLLELLQSVGQKTLLLGEQNIIPSPNCENHTTSQNKQVLQKALEEIPSSSFSVIRLALDSKHATADLHAESSSKMRAKLSDMLTVYAGPFAKGLCLKTAKRAFRTCGHMRSIRIVSETLEASSQIMLLPCGRQRMPNGSGLLCIPYPVQFLTPPHLALTWTFGVETHQSAGGAWDNLDGPGCVQGLAKLLSLLARHIRIAVSLFSFPKPHLCIQYEVLEAAELALERLNGAEVGGSVIKVQRPVTEMTLDGEMLVKELEEDPNNEGIVYLVGLGQRQDEMSLQERWGPWEGLSSVFRPRDPQTGRRRNYCFLRFQTAENASRVLQIIEDQTARGSKLWSRKALTPFTLFQWVCLANENSGKLAEWHRIADLPPFDAEHGLKKAIKTLDRRIKTLYENVPERMLCVVLLPGANRLSNSPGLGLMGIKDGGNPLAPCYSIGL